MIEKISVFHQSSSAIFGNLRKLFGNVPKKSGNFRLPFETIFENLRKSSENRQKRRHQHVFIVFILKRTLHISSKI